MLTDREKLLIVFAAALVVLVVLYVFAVTFIPIPDSGKDHAKFALAFLLGTAVGTILTYFWGSSQGSADKTALLAKTEPPREEPPRDVGTI